MKKQEQTIYDPNTGQNVAPRVTVTKAPEIKPDFNSLVRTVARWIAGKVLPTVFLTVLAGFATKGVQTYLPEMNDTTRTIASIAVVAVMVVMVLAGDKDKV